MISEEYNSLFSKNEFYPLQKAYTTPHFLVLIIRFPGRTVAIYIGRGNQYQGIFISEKAPPSYLRVQDRLLDYLRKYLVGARLGKMEVGDKSMVSLFHFKNEHSDNAFLFGYKDRQLFFAKQSKEDVYLSWTGETLQAENLLTLVDPFGPDKISNTISQKTWEIADYLKEEEIKIAGKPIQRKKEKFLTRKINNISDDLSNVKNWSLLQMDLNEDKLDLNSDELKIYGQKIKLHGLNSSWLKRDLVFKKIKKLKKAEQILTSRLVESQEEYKNVLKGNFDFEVTKEKIIQPLWITHQKQFKAQNMSYNYKNIAMGNLTGMVGLDASSNDWIRAQSSKEHYWFHIENYTGAHCIIKTEDFSKLTFEYLEAIASMLRDYSKLEIQEIPILFTQIKNIKGIKGVKGAVTVKKPKHLRCLYKNWKEIISIL
ncbi:MAG: NFACT RNA binding domain-containing protein [Bacteriovorax sp.]|nr:NFACT RNA binding domain-containing protein [Bacteriovorax sp.]